MTHFQHTLGLGIGGTAIGVVLLSSYLPTRRELSDSAIHPTPSSGSAEAEVLAARRLFRAAINSEEPFFTGLGQLPHGSFTRVAKDLSGDGAAIVGYTYSKLGLKSFRFTPEDGFVSLAGGLDSSDIVANAVSTDGTTVVGSITSFKGAEAFRWRADEGVVLLGNLPGKATSIARAVSGDGGTVVGECDDDAFRWTADEGMVRLIGLPPGCSRFVAHDISADGTVVVGSCQGPTYSTVAFCWTESSGGVVLKNTINSGELIAKAVTADGAVVVGMAGNEAFRWTADGGVVPLERQLAGNGRTLVSDVSADGSVIVGAHESIRGVDAFLWDAKHGMRTVREVLSDELNLANSLVGWRLTNVSSVSGDGRFIAGMGWNAQDDLEAWMARVGE
ncbi:MAG: hypothetical protein KDA61_16210 [Planctomycetales bacterium]|nr:hypothetical protein [Planctomycetales bacterium]